ncbi:MAG: Flp pilus assembly complex ATPase component TadA [Pseudomonadota bacterium]|nr:Flp pilus assembly complex ATPase component TadA [Pseudomonadota bacterium]
MNGLDIPDDSTHAVFLDLVKNIVPYMADKSVSEIMVNRPNDVWIKQNGSLVKVDCDLDGISIRSAMQALARIEQKEIQENTEAAILDCHIGPFRIACVMSPTAVDGHAMCIRKHSSSNMTLDDYRENGFFNPPETNDSVSNGSLELWDILRNAVKNKKNILVAGGTDTGKTTMLNALIAEIPGSDRVISIEDTIELNVRVQNKVRLLSNAQAGIHMRDLLRLSLRMRPDRIVVGEVRGEEAYDLLQVFNSGHDGGFATIHASNGKKALMRLESLVMQSEAAKMGYEAIKLMVASTINYVVFLKSSGGKRYLSELLEITDFDDGKYVMNNLVRR